jgi:hypothetical protein
LNSGKQDSAHLLFADVERAAAGHVKAYPHPSSCPVSIATPSFITKPALSALNFVCELEENAPSRNTRLLEQRRLGGFAEFLQVDALQHAVVEQKSALRRPASSSSPEGSRPSRQCRSRHRPLPSTMSKPAAASKERLQRHTIEIGLQRNRRF